MDLINQGDLILTDRGFLVSVDLAARDATFVIPYFTRRKQQLSAREVEEVEQIPEYASM